MVEEELAKANAKMYSKEIERLQMAVKDTKENADAIIIEQQEEIERLNKECDTYMKISTQKQQRIDKAIKTLKSNIKDHNYDNASISALDILQGSDKE